jgi:hypothetical protein
VSLAFQTTWFQAWVSDRRTGLGLTASPVRLLVVALALLLAGSWGWLSSVSAWGCVASALGGTTCGFLGLWVASTLKEDPPLEHHAARAHDARQGVRGLARPSLAAHLAPACLELDEV